jgi:FkbM family methyltransferase
MMTKIYKKLTNFIKNIPIGILISYYRFFQTNKSDTIRFLGYKIFVQNFTSFYYEVIYIFKDKIYDFESTKKSPLIIDGGACIGMSLFYFKKKYPYAKIVAFEPSLDVFKILQKNIKDNNLKDIELLNSGLYDSNSELSFSKNNIDSGKIDNNGDIKVRVVKLSDYINEEVDFLKMNIEGAEYSVLKDLNESRKINQIKEMCFEWHSFANQSQNLDEILNILKSNNFKYYISSFSTSSFGKFKIEKNMEYFIIIYAKQVN